MPESAARSEAEEKNWRNRAYANAERIALSFLFGFTHSKFKRIEFFL